MASASKLHQSVQRTGEYVKVSDSVASVTDSAWFDADIGASINSPTPVKIRDLRVLYPGGDESVSLPLSDLIIE